MFNLLHTYLVKSTNKSELINEAKNYAIQNSIKWNDEIADVFSVLINYPELSPKLKLTKKDGNENCSIIGKWIQKFDKGRNNKPSKRISNPPGTLPDKLVDQILKTRFSTLTEETIENIKYAHRISMNTETIIGDLLEEYIDNKLSRYGWHCAWNSTLKHVDFINKNNMLLQVKNKYNTENNASQSVRDGTKIQKWFRLKQNGQQRWDEINQLLEVIIEDQKLSENDFFDFVSRVIKKNPNCLGIDLESPLFENRTFTLDF